MRATERLLEVIEERQGSIRKAIAPDGGTVADAKVHSDALDIKEAVAELRRRGDTLVRADDLRLVAAAANHGRQYGPGGDTDYTGFEAALARIEEALGGR